MEHGKQDVCANCGMVYQLHNALTECRKGDGKWFPKSLADAITKSAASPVSPPDLRPLVRDLMTQLKAANAWGHDLQILLEEAKDMAGLTIFVCGGTYKEEDTEILLARAEREIGEQHD